MVIMGIFVDDLLVTGYPPKAIDHAENQLAERFEYKIQGELGEVEYYVGVEFTQVDQHTLLLHQSPYVNSVLETFKMQDCKPVSTLLPLNLDLSLKDSPEEVVHALHCLQSEYRAIVGSLMYLYQ